MYKRQGVSWLARTYAKSIHVALKLRYLLLLVFFAGLGATVWTYQHVPTGFIPQEDQSFLMVIVQAPPGSSLAYTSALADRAQAIIYSNPDIAGAFSVMGFSLSGGASNAGMMFISTTPSDKRRGKGHSCLLYTSNAFWSIFETIRLLNAILRMYSVSYTHLTRVCVPQIGTVWPGRVAKSLGTVHSSSSACYRRIVAFAGRSWETSNSQGWLLELRKIHLPAQRPSSVLWRVSLGAGSRLSRTDVHSSH